MNELFRDAPRHGPRWPELAVRVFAATWIVAAVVALAASRGWQVAARDVLENGLALRAVSSTLLAADLAVAAVLLAPFARVRLPLAAAAGMIALTIGATLVHQGWWLPATVPTAVGALMLGGVAANALRRSVLALPVLFVAAVADVLSVEGGATLELLRPVATGAGPRAATWKNETEPRTIDFVVVHLPSPDGTWLLGVVDVFAIGVLTAVAYLLWQPTWRTVAAVVIAVAAALSAPVAVPVLPALGGAWLVVHARLVFRATRFAVQRHLYVHT